MSDEHDSWFQSAFGFDVEGAVQAIKAEVSAAATQVEDTVTQVVQGAQGAAESVIDGAIGVVTGAAKKVAVAAGLGGGGAEGGSGGAASGDAGGSGSFPLRGSVGRGGQNQAGDVKAVQAALGITADGKCGSQTIGAIEAFQRSQGLPKADGRVDPGGATERALSGGGGGSGGGAPGAPAGVDVRNDLSGADDAGGASAAGPPAIAEDDIPRVEGETVLDEVETDGDAGGDTPAGPAATATIEVRAKGDGSFTITGSGFQQPLVSIRAVDDAFGERWFPTQTKDGKLSFTTPAICVAAGPIHFSVLAGTHPLVSDLLSNIAHSSCEAPEPKGGKGEKDDGDEEPEQPEDEDEDEGEKIHAALRTTYSIKVRYWVQDMSGRKRMLVDGDRFGPGEEIWFDCEGTGAPDTGRVACWRDSTERGGDEIPARVILVSHNKVSDLQV